MNFFADRQWLTDFEKLKEIVWGVWGDVLGFWDGNHVKLDCGDHCTTINVINSLSNINKIK